MNQLKFTQTTQSSDKEFPTGQVCPLPVKGIGSAKGAMGSAVATIIL